MLATLCKKILSLRYDITIEGLEQLKGLDGVLILPNHPAEIDPVIISTYLWKCLRPRPVVLETFFNAPALQPLMKFIRAIPMADMGFEAGPYKRRRIEQSLRDVTYALRARENILIYPSGALSVTGVERIGGNSGVYTILQQVPECHIAVITIRGLYGSIFSKALTGGTTPHLKDVGVKGLQILLKNLLLRVPKRAVRISIAVDPPDFPRLGSPVEINRYLEGIYNSPTPETPTLISYSGWREELPTLPEKPQESAEQKEIPVDVASRVLQHIAHISKRPIESLTHETQLGDDLGLDSLTVAELLIWLDREFEVSDVELSDLMTVGAILHAAAGHLGLREVRHEFVVPPAWSAGLDERPHPELPPSFLIPEAFLKTSLAFGSYPAMGDERTGVMTWSRVRFRALLLARHIAQLPGSHVGILFPASVAGTLCTMATLVAGKIPVFLNWTAGRRSLEHAISTTGIATVLTSRAFLDIVPTDLHFLEQFFLFAEDLKKKFTVWDFLAAKRLDRESTTQLLEAFGLTDRDPDSPAVVLFTSGSEALPKGVPLTHRNIFANVRGVLEAFQVRREDVLMGFLPPFHSFGLTICTLLPLMSGLRVAFHPNPNESRKIAKSIQKWRASIAAGTPTFLRSILKSGNGESFNSLRTLVSGAERAPQELFDAVRNAGPSIALVEGYGITECSPVVSLTRPDEERVGVGRPITGVQLKIVHPETLEEVPVGEQGLILIRGDSVFSGYLDPNLNPFIEIGADRVAGLPGDKWYNSGDLGRLENGSLVITGRLKRFIKIAGEMVSLGAVEEALQAKVPSLEGVPTVAVLAKGSEGDARPQLILFASQPVSAGDANTTLKESGFPPLVHISEVRELREIPILGSGKTDYQSLKAAMG